MGFGLPPLGFYDERGNVKTGLVLSSNLFNDEPVEADVEYFPDAESVGDPVTVTFLMLPIDDEMWAEYRKRSGLDEQEFNVRVETDLEKVQNSDDFRPKVQIEPKGQKTSKVRDIAAKKWLAKNFIKGWVRGLVLDDGEPLPFTEKNLARLAAQETFIQPAIRKGRQLAGIKRGVEEKNLPTS